MNIVPQFRARIRFQERQFSRRENCHSWKRIIRGAARRELVLLVPRFRFLFRVFPRLAPQEPVEVDMSPSSDYIQTPRFRSRRKNCLSWSGVRLKFFSKNTTSSQASTRSSVTAGSCTPGERVRRRYKGAGGMSRTRVLRTRVRRSWIILGGARRTSPFSRAGRSNGGVWFGGSRQAQTSGGTRGGGSRGDSAESLGF